METTDLVVLDLAQEIVPGFVQAVLVLLELTADSSLDGWWPRMVKQKPRNHFREDREQR